MLGGFLADNDYILGIAFIMICEITTADDLNTHRSEITGSDYTVDGIGLLTGRRIR